jgi:hypothetical protein
LEVAIYPLWSRPRGPVPFVITKPVVQELKQASQDPEGDVLARLLDKNLRDRPAASQDLPGRGNEGGKDQFRTARHVAVDLSTSSTQTPSSSLITEAASPGAAGRMPNLYKSYENNSHLVDWKGLFRTGIIPSWPSEARSRSLFAFRKSRIAVDGIGMIACFIGVHPSIRQ